LITDGRFSGGTRGLCIGHVSPEAAEGGPIALIKDGDTVEIDLNMKTIDLVVARKEMDKRKATWKRPGPKIKEGYMATVREDGHRRASGAIFEDSGRS